MLFIATRWRRPLVLRLASTGGRASRIERAKYYTRRTKKPVAYLLIGHRVERELLPSRGDF